MNVESASLRIGKEEMVVKPTKVPIPDDNPNNDFDRPIKFKSITIYTSQDEIDRLAKLLQSMDPKKTVRVVVNSGAGAQSVGEERACMKSETMTVKDLLAQIGK